MNHALLCAAGYAIQYAACCCGSSCCCCSLPPFCFLIVKCLALLALSGNSVMADNLFECENQSSCVNNCPVKRQQWTRYVLLLYCRASAGSRLLISLTCVKRKQTEQASKNLPCHLPSGRAEGGKASAAWFLLKAHQHGRCQVRTHIHTRSHNMQLAIT